MTYLADELSCKELVFAHVLVSSYISSAHYSRLLDVLWTNNFAEAWYHSSQIQQHRITFYLLLSTSHLTPSPFNRRGDPFIQICMIWRQTLFLNLSSCLKRFEWKKNPVEKAKLHESCKDYSSTSTNRKVIWKIDLKKCILENNSSHLTGVSSEPFRFSSWLIHSWWNILLPQNF